MTEHDFKRYLGLIEMSPGRFAAFTGHDVRTVRRWLTGESAVPRWLDSWMAMAVERRRLSRVFLEIPESIPEPGKMVWPGER